MADNLPSLVYNYCYFQLFLLQIDALDTLALLGDHERFASSVEWIGKNLRFEIVSMDFMLSFDGKGTPFHYYLFLYFFLLITFWEY